MSSLFRFACVWSIGFFLVACGGGGGTQGSEGGAPASTPIVPKSAPAANSFTGSYASQCFAVVNGTNFETGDRLYAKPLLQIAGSTGATASTAFRFDFFDDAACSSEPLGALTNNNAANVFTVYENAMAGSRVATKVSLAFGSPMATFSAGPTNDTVIFGTNLRLKLPRNLVNAFTALDWWSLNGSDLYEGTSDRGPDGYPTTLSSTSTTTKIPTMPPLPGQPCAAQTINWAGSNANCSAPLFPTASGRSRAASYTDSVKLGSAEFTCSNGVWSTPQNATCALSEVYCPSQTVTWTEGSETCSGTLPQTSFRTPVASVSNSLPGKTGVEIWSCKPNGSWGLWVPGATGSCKLIPPPVTITDPLQLAQARNCLNCHNVTGKGFSLPGSSLSFPSFEEIADHYRSSTPNQSILANRVKNGSVGELGQTPMPSNPQASDADLAILIPWILAQPK
jgi:cytochrome c